MLIPEGEQTAHTRSHSFYPRTGYHILTMRQDLLSKRQKAPLRGAFLAVLALSFSVPALAQSEYGVIERESHRIAGRILQRDGERVLFQEAKFTGPTYDPRLSFKDPAWAPTGAVTALPRSRTRSRGTKRFIRLHHQDRPKKIGSYKYGSEGSRLLFDVVSTQDNASVSNNGSRGAVTIINKVGKQETISGKAFSAGFSSLKTSSLMSLDWDIENNLPAQKEPEWFAAIGLFVHEYSLMAAALALLWALVLFIPIPLTGKWALAMTGSSAIFFAFWAAGAIGEVFIKSREATELKRAFFYAAAKDANGGFLPFDPGYHLDVRQGGGFPVTVLLLVLLPVACMSTLALLPKIVPALHFIFVAHPAEKEIAASLRERRPINPQAVSDSMKGARRDKIPPVWKSRNWTERLQALSGRVRAERDLMRDVIERERTRSRRDDR